MGQETLLPIPIGVTYLETGETIRIVEGEAWQSVDNSLWGIRENDTRIPFNARTVKEHITFSSKLKISDNGSEIFQYGTCKIIFNELVAYCFTYTYCDVIAGMEMAKRAIESLRRIPFMTLWTRAEVATNLIGRPVYWREQPAFVADYISDTGMLALRPANGSFSPRPWEHSLVVMTSVDVDILDPDIHWSRELSEDER